MVINVSKLKKIEKSLQNPTSKLNYISQKIQNPLRKTSKLNYIY